MVWNKKWRLWLLLAVLALVSGCATYYQQNLAFQNLWEAGKIAEAQGFLEKSGSKVKDNNRVLYNLNVAASAFLMGDHAKSVEYFKMADLYDEDYSKSLGYEVLSMVTNPMTKPYRLEYFESVMIHFYQALNFIALNDYEAALVECRRVNVRLQKINDEYKNHQNKYARDAFAHNLMGIIYEAAGDFNNAFIAYRNAIDVYENEYLSLFKVGVPQQLKVDVIRVAALVGFGDQVDFFERKFGISYSPQEAGTGSVVCFWLNGLGPVKSEWSFNFVNTGLNDGFVTLANEDTGMSFPFYLGRQSDTEQGALKNLRALRVAFPKYTARAEASKGASLVCGNVRVPLEMGQNINSIAFQSLSDRMWREMANSLLRLATKKALEEVTASQNKNMGAILSIVNAMTEKADTRNWQTLPFSISYGRLSLPAGTHSVSIVPTDGGSTTTHQVKVRPGGVSFVSLQQF